ncbi:MAG: formate/nitrite transporter family protein [Mycoplasmoidaceae bacterium]|nr:formate/nitrite transporter family protein [Mycoplasmoidaceae bacterium]
MTKLIYGFLAGFFVGIGYTAMLVIEKKLTGGVDDALTKFFGSLIFCTGIVMCMFVGANLFTGNCAVYAPVITKRISRKRFYLDLLLTFVGNYIGSIAIVLLI